ncbi:MAG TPA: 6-carboxytetrahydropterin synthase [Actinomycetes bacterium]|jgi:6-pyruvoyltetrahydropterin/6-carboxytetrahydropterin synthase|nr:6-carboxytetrahydropterin synthase [Actinomycetota bacterium]HEV3495897.1 6-carboxytetrahydropterin synthase [Actinomycetes bacterium]HEX2155638.1 6-carboxytetrahydropterin synthase [Actinomycetes bacterium]
MTVGYEVGSSVTVRALHQMPVEGPEGELHAHDYRIDVVVGRRALDEHGMVCDLDALRAALQATVARIEGKDLEEIRPPEAEAVTVEVLARWAHQQLVPALRQAGGDTLAVRVWESEADFGGYAGPVA